MSTDPAQMVVAAHGEVTACWNSIGVHGDKSCPTLTEQVHCRNCPVHAAAAKALLDSALPEGYARNWAAMLAQPPPETHADIVSVTVFRLGAECFGVPTRLCVEVASARPIHSLPHRRSQALLGVANIRGELVVCLSLAVMLGLAGAATLARDADEQRLLVMRWPEGSIAFPVDEVLGVKRYGMSEFSRPPATVAHAQNRYTQSVLRWNQRTVGFLEDELLRRTVSRSLT
jgi:chemotaxis-related protein WspD